MTRLQIQLDPAQHRQIKQRAKRLGVSVAEVIRRCIAAQFRDEAEREPDEPVRRARAMIGRYAESRGPSRTAEQHDKALAVAYRK